MPVTVAHDPLRAFAAAMLEERGVPPADAALVADSLVQADLWGHQSHGVLRLGWYWARLQSGAIQAATKPERVVDAGAVAVIDGHDGIGQVLAAAAAQEAIQRAKVHGIAAVAVRNSNHFGTAAYFSRRAPEVGCIALLTTNASPAMAPWGARQKLVGNNPWSLAAPAGRHAPMVLDIANTVVARGKIYLARQRGEPIPPGWAIDADGVPTTDPAAAIAGIILPMGEHKGYAISLMMDVLSGVLSGSGFAAEVSGPYQAERPSRCGHLMIALDIARFLPLAEFGTRMEQLIAAIRGAPLAPGFDRVFYPGEVEWENDRRHRRSGVTLPDDTVADLTRLARAAGLERTLPF